MPNYDDLESVYRQVRKEQMEQMTPEEREQAEKAEEKRAEIVKSLMELNPKIKESKMNDKIELEITSDPNDNREIILEIIKQLRSKDGKPPSREIALAVTKLEEARFWLGEAVFGSGASSI